MEILIGLTQEAVRAVKMSAEAQGVPLEEVYLRVGIKGESCCGFSYLIEFTREKIPDDHEIEIDGIRVLVDRESYPNLEGATIDYVVTDNLLTTEFVFRNPKNRPTCGCRKLHSLDEGKS